MIKVSAAVKKRPVCTTAAKTPHAPGYSIAETEERTSGEFQSENNVTDNLSFSELISLSKQTVVNAHNLSSFPSLVSVNKELQSDIECHS